MKFGNQSILFFTHTRRSVQASAKGVHHGLHGLDLPGERIVGVGHFTSIAVDLGHGIVQYVANHGVGMFANMPVGTPHSFKNESSRPAKMLILVAPAGLEGMFFEFGVPVPQGATTAPPPTKDEIERLLAVAPKYGIEIMLPKH